MNTLQNLLDNGIEEYTANKMLSEYKSRIGTMNGVYKIVDINYDFSVRGKDVALECSKCGKVIHRTMINGRNKWSELIKSCPCEKAEKLKQERLILEQLAEIKRELILSRIGEVHGDYEIISAKNLDGKTYYTTRCNICGAEKIILAESFERRKTFHCKKHYTRPVKFDESYIGKKNNFLKVIGIKRTDKNRKLFVCECDCGNIKDIEPAIWEQGIVKSCGCKHKELSSENSKTHGHSGDRLYRVYRGMIERCYNSNNPNYHNYGGRGIKVCDEWLDDFMNFYNWSIESGYDYNADFGQCTIDRIDVNGNYEPSNCRWADLKVQANNKRPSSEWKKREIKTWTIDGEAKTIDEWCKQYNTSSVAIRYRMKKLGMTLEQALKAPKMTMGRPRKE